LKEQGLSDRVALLQTGCHGFCEQGPLLVIEPGNILYCRIKPEDTEKIVSETVGKGRIIEELLYTNPVTGKKIEKEGDVEFYKGQTREILAQNKEINPRNIEDYIGEGGYAALSKALSSLEPEQVIEEINRSGLRGRGGGGFPTGRKWESCRLAEGQPKYVICNADEGDPGAYMDRSVLEGNPHSVVEGMLIGAYAIGARHGFIYVRNEYPLAIQNAKIALAQAEERGLLGENILGTAFSFDIKIARGGGAFVCGESTALMASLEGKVGEPRSKIIHTVEKGYKDKPSTLNNVETWANVPHIVNRGSSWFAGIGTDRSKGTKIFALTGKIKNTGLVEVAMGTTLREIVFDIGGGALDGNSIKAVQTGGPSGGCIPESMFDLRVDFEELDRAGSMMGSGGLVVLDEESCMVDVAKYFLTFILDESCGKCSVCRIGTSRMLEILRDITEGTGTASQLELLAETARTVSLASLCALGKTAPNPVKSTLRYFKKEYLAHIDEKRCPAKVCRSLIRVEINAEKCTGCGVCVKACAAQAIEGESKKAHRIDQDLCTKCRICLENCRFDAILVA
jgi:NADH-quinone oxidoreductase subunit F